MILVRRLAVAAALAAAPAAGVAATIPSHAVAPAPASTPVTGGELSVRTESCGGSGSLTGPREPQAQWLDDDRVVMTYLTHFNARVHLPGMAWVDIDVRGPFVVAWIPTMVQDAGSGPVDTCLYAALLRLEIRGLPRGDYEWILRDGDRASDADYEAAITRALAQRAAKHAGVEADAPAGPDARGGDRAD